MDDIIARLHALTIRNLATTPLPAATTPKHVSIVDNLEHAVEQLTLRDIGPPPHLPSPGIGPSTGSSPPDGDLKCLWLLDEKFDYHMKSIILSFDALSSPDPSSQHKVEVDLTTEKCWLQESIRELCGLEHHHDPDIQVLSEAMHNRMAQFTAAIESCIEILQKRSPSQSSQHVVNSGDVILPMHFIH
jgi:hypothetical protein